MFLSSDAEFWIRYRISEIDMECFQELATLEWLKINNNLLRSLPYTLMEPVLGTLKYIDVYSKICNP